MHIYTDGKVHGAHLGPTGHRWTPCWPHELCYLGYVSPWITMFHSYPAYIHHPYYGMKDMIWYHITACDCLHMRYDYVHAHSQLITYCIYPVLKTDVLHCQESCQVTCLAPVVDVCRYLSFQYFTLRNISRAPVTGKFRIFFCNSNNECVRMCMCSDGQYFMSGCKKCFLGKTLNKRSAEVFAYITTKTFLLPIFPRHFCYTQVVTVGVMRC